MKTRYVFSIIAVGVAWSLGSVYFSKNFQIINKDSQAKITEPPVEDGNSGCKYLNITYYPRAQPEAVSLVFDCNGDDKLDVVSFGVHNLSRYPKLQAWLKHDFDVNRYQGEADIEVSTLIPEIHIKK